MRGSGALVSLLALALFLLLKVSANPSHPFHLPANETILGHLELAEGEEQCGNRDGDKKCPCRECCSIWGFCGTGPEYCDPQTCQSQCEVPAATGMEIEGHKNVYVVIIHNLKPSSMFSLTVNQHATYEKFLDILWASNTKANHVVATGVGVEKYAKIVSNHNCQNQYIQNIAAKTKTLSHVRQVSVAVSLAGVSTGEFCYPENSQIQCNGGLYCPI
ncbi:hypothetical protein FXO38_13211 [Capsicum annuum]|uniref:Chitin-binding type-1 domain-containing protein n=1 Tax=Capsicum annuum TaxID=4072 RepID=A0A2G3A2B8_CAPAN|nr:hypothetical protein FXO38_13211 [Capsicum annuum]KAF3661095.1 hypothetical protein FXO37_13087 [Capsicum annuum]PHT88377.1 hypothetical protein T459_10483 [Capsicum annuum]